MANIAARKGEMPAALAAVPRWEPSRFARDFLGWDPFGAMSSMPRAQAGFTPTFEIKETADAYLFKADVPGVKEGDLQVTVSGNRLFISGTREAEKEEQTDAYHTYERVYGDFSRTFTLPAGADMNSVRADLTDGVLTVVLGKTREAETRKIAVQTATKTS